MNPYIAEPDARKRTRRVIVTLPLRTPDPTQQPALPLDPPQPAAPTPTITERFESFHRANPHVYLRLKSMALEIVSKGGRQARPKDLVERLRSEGVSTTDDGKYAFDNSYTSHYARLLDAEPELAGQIPMRKLVSQ